MSSITPAQYSKLCKRRFGTKNPERMHEPVWEWMVRSGNTPYEARVLLGLETGHWDRPRNPDWCFDRIGAARVEMADGRTITIAGEHEDFYDPHFCIYNDVIVQHGDCVEIYGYPCSTFPPTDFHTATLYEGRIYIIGSLGYKEERGGNHTPVYVLDPQSYRIKRMTYSGQSPGWIYEHSTEFVEGLDAIRVWGGKCVDGDPANECIFYNRDTYLLHMKELRWQHVSGSEH